MRISLLLTGLLFTACQQQKTPTTEKLKSPTTSLLQAINIVDEYTVWFSGHHGTFLRSKDQGYSWELFQHPTADTLQFRDIHAFGENKVILMSAGPGPLSRLFTFTAPDSWEENFVMQDSLGFLDCIDFWDDQRGIAYGDAVDDYPYILLTNDGGQSWQRGDTTHMPKAGTGEGGFAASGTCVTTGENGNAWIATGAGGNARILLTEDFGKTWKAVDSPLVKGEASGNTSISMAGDIGIVAGGDLLQPDEYTDNCAFTLDGGTTWSLSNQTQTPGAFYGGALTKSSERHFAFICSPKGIQYSEDLGQNWTTLDTLNYWAISFVGKIGYASGTEGKILKINLH